MRAFHALIFSRRNAKERVVVGRELGGFDWTLFRKGRPFLEAFPPAVKLFVNDGPAPDYLYNPLSWPICSMRLRQILEDGAGHDFQSVPAPLHHATSGERIEGYTIVNVTTIVDCLNIDKSTVSYMQIGGKQILHVIKYALNEAMIPHDVHLFRVKDSLTSIVLSDELATQTVGKGLKGLAFVRLTSV